VPSSLFIGAPVVFQACDHASKWYYTKEELFQSQERPSFCVSAAPDSNDLVFAICDQDDYLQKFEFDWYKSIKTHTLKAIPRDREE